MLAKVATANGFRLQPVNLDVSSPNIPIVGDLGAVVALVVGLPTPIERK